MAPRLALVHDYLLVMRGAERTFAAMAEEWPEAPILTLLYDEEGTGGRFAGRAITTSPLQRLGVRQRGFRALLPVLGPAARALPLEGFDAIVSSSSAFAHGISKPPGARHVCYCHSPFRYAWHERGTTRSEVPAPLRPAVGLALARHRRSDLRAAGRVDQYVANSELTRERIARLWGRESVVVHPPVDVDRFAPGRPGEHVLVVGELVRHKRVDVAIAAAAAAGRRLLVVGTGPDRERLQAAHPTGVEFLGRVGDAELAELYAGAAALVVPNVEEFGIAAVEAQAAGRPVVAWDAGGTRETVVHGRTGLLVDPARGVGGLADALREDLTAFDPEVIRAHAQQFSRPAFQRRLREVVEEVCGAG